MRALFYGLLILIFFQGSFIWPKSSNSAKFIKRYGIVRNPVLAVKQKASEESPTVAGILFGQWVRLITYLDVSEGMENKADIWLEIKTAASQRGFVRLSNLLLLDYVQKDLWLHDHFLYQVIKKRSPLFLAKDFNEVKTKPSENFAGYLDKGSLIWALKETPQYLYFRYLIKGPFFYLAYLKKKNALKLNAKKYLRGIQ
jgi:hypothetical protein